MSKELSKEERQDLLKRIIHDEHVRTQADVVAALKRRGVKGVLQSTISRDLLELGALKKNGAYYLSEDADATANWAELIRQRARELKRAGPYTLVVKVEPGTASLICLEIDALGWPELVGTLAGEDTIFMAFDSERDQQKIRARLAKVMGMDAASI